MSVNIDPKALVQKTMKQRMTPWLLGAAMGGTVGTAGYMYLVNRGILPGPKFDQPVPSAVDTPPPILEAPWDNPVYDYEEGVERLADNYYNYLL